MADWTWLSTTDFGKVSISTEDWMKHAETIRSHRLKLHLRNGLAKGTHLIESENLADSEFLSIAEFMAVKATAYFLVSETSDKDSPLKDFLTPTREQVLSWLEIFTPELSQRPRLVNRIVSRLILQHPEWHLDSHVKREAYVFVPRLSLEELKEALQVSEEIPEESAILLLPKNFTRSERQPTVSCFAL